MKMPELPDILEGTCVGVSDGDSFHLELSGGERVRVRLFGIDAPEKDQEHALQARKMLGKLIYNKDLRVKIMDIDQYGRYVGKAYAGARYVNRYMLKKGMAWLYSHYAADDELLAEAEASARAAGRGIWACVSPLRPRNFRSECRKGKK
ncbi:MAG: thermonuclease family protein [Akkermansia sp.]|nr:thermonuclease family protein [Akkermansia sp.]